MLKSFVSRLRKNLCVYLCCLVGLALAARSGGLGWLNWLAAGLCVLSVVLCFACAVRERMEEPPC